MQNASVNVADNQMALNRDIQVPMSQTVTVDALTCSDEGGKISINGGLVDLRGLAVRIDFRNNLKGTHTATRTTIVDLGRVKLADEHAVAEAAGTSSTGNTYVSFQLVDGQENPISDEVFLGRCGEASGSVPLRSPQPAKAVVNTLSRNCGRSSGPVVNVSSTLELEGMKLRFAFRDTDDISTPPRASWIAPATLTLVNAGQQIELYKQPSLGGVGGNPFIYVTIVDATGRELSEEVLLGRCNGEPPDQSEPMANQG
jgi:hypothetical protein